MERTVAKFKVSHISLSNLAYLQIEVSLVINHHIYRSRYNIFSDKDNF